MRVSPGGTASLARSAEYDITERRFKLDLLILRIPEFRRIKQGAQNGSYIAIAALESFGELRDETLRRIIGDKILRQFISNVVRRRRMRRQEIENIFSTSLAPPSLRSVPPP